MESWMLRSKYAADASKSFMAKSRSQNDKFVKNAYVWASSAWLLVSDKIRITKGNFSISEAEGFAEDAGNMASMCEEESKRSEYHKIQGDKAREGFAAFRSEFYAAAALKSLARCERELSLYELFRRHDNKYLEWIIDLKRRDPDEDGDEKYSDAEYRPGKDSKPGEYKPFSGLRKMGSKDLRVGYDRDMRN